VGVHRHALEGNRPGDDEEHHQHKHQKSLAKRDLYYSMDHLSLSLRSKPLMHLAAPGERDGSCCEPLDAQAGLAASCSRLGMSLRSKPLMHLAAPGERDGSCCEPLDAQAGLASSCSRLGMSLRSK